MQLRKVYLVGFLTERRHNIVNGGYGSTNNKQDVYIYTYIHSFCKSRALRFVYVSRMLLTQRILKLNTEYKYVLLNYCLVRHRKNQVWESNLRVVSTYVFHIITHKYLVDYGVSMLKIKCSKLVVSCIPQKLEFI